MKKIFGMKYLERTDKVHGGASRTGQALKLTRGENYKDVQVETF